MRYIKRYKCCISLPNLVEEGCENIVHLLHPLQFSTQVFLNCCSLDISAQLLVVSIYSKGTQIGKAWHRYPI